MTEIGMLAWMSIRSGALRGSGSPRRPPGLCDVHSWLQLQMDGAEQDYRVPYRDLLKYGKNVPRTALLRFSWSDGIKADRTAAILRSIPTRPRYVAGTVRRDCEDPGQGSQMILFGKPIFADMSTDYYKKELYKYEAVDHVGQ